MSGKAREWAEERGGEGSKLTHVVRAGGWQSERVREIATKCQLGKYLFSSRNAIRYLLDALVPNIVIDIECNTVVQQSRHTQLSRQQL